MGRVLFPRFGIDFFETSGPGSQQIKADILAGRLQLLQSLGLALFIASLSNSDVDQFHACFAQYAQGDAADDALVVGMRGEKERGGGICRKRFRWQSREAAEREGAAFFNKASEFG